MDLPFYGYPEELAWEDLVGRIMALGRDTPSNMVPNCEGFIHQHQKLEPDLGQNW